MAGQARLPPCGFWWSILLWSAPEPDFGPPFSGRRLLMGAHQRGVQPDIIVVRSIDQVIKHLLPDPGPGPAGEACMLTSSLAQSVISLPAELSVSPSSSLKLISFKLDCA